MQNDRHTSVHLCKPILIYPYLKASKKQETGRQRKRWESGILVGSTFNTEYRVAQDKDQVGWSCSQNQRPLGHGDSWLSLTYEVFMWCVEDRVCVMVWGGFDGVWAWCKYIHHTHVSDCNLFDIYFFMLHLIFFNCTDIWRELGFKYTCHSLLLWTCYGSICENNTWNILWHHCYEIWASWM